VRGGATAGRQASRQSRPKLTRRDHKKPQPASPFPMAELVYIDYPDLLLHARRLGAVQLGRAKSTRQASSRRIQDPNYRFDLKTLYGHFVGIDYPHLSRGTLFSSSAPLQHRVIKPAQEAG